MPVEQESIDYDPDQVLSFLLVLLLYLAKRLLPPFRDIAVNRYVFLLVEVIMGVMLGWYLPRLFDLDASTSVCRIAA